MFWFVVNFKVETLLDSHLALFFFGYVVIPHMYHIA